MNRENDIQSGQPIEYGCEPIQKVKSTVHLEVEPSKSDRPDALEDHCVAKSSVWV